MLKERAKIRTGPLVVSGPGDGMGTNTLSGPRSRRDQWVRAPAALVIVALSASACDFSFRAGRGAEPLPDSCVTWVKKFELGRGMVRGDEAWRALPTLEQILDDLDGGVTVTAEAALGVLFDEDFNILTRGAAEQVFAHNDAYLDNCRGR